MKEKTVKEWIDTIKSDDIRNRFYDNAFEYNRGITLDTKTKSLELAIGSAFSWSDSKEGLKFWSNIAKESALKSLKVIAPDDYEIY